MFYQQPLTLQDVVNFAIEPSLLMTQDLFET